MFGYKINGPIGETVDCVVCLCAYVNKTILLLVILLRQDFFKR